MPKRSWATEPTIVTRPVRPMNKRQRGLLPPVPPVPPVVEPEATPPAPMNDDNRWPFAAALVLIGGVLLVIGLFLIFAKTSGYAYDYDMFDAMKDQAKEFRGYVFVIVGAMFACTGSLAWLVGPK